MKFKDLKERESTVYMVSRKNPSSLTEMTCFVITKETARLRNYFYYWRWGNRDADEFILVRKSLNKRSVRRDGHPSVVYITNDTQYLPLSDNDLNKGKYEDYRHIFFLDKKAACDYIIDKIKRKKLELNATIIKINKLKFSIAE